MNILIIDTSSNLLYVGLLSNGVSTFITRLGKNDNAAYLIDRIDIILKESKLTINDVDEIIVGVGPGSYTGSRVAVVVAKTLAFTKNIRLSSISSLNLLSSGYKNTVSVAIDARRSHYFVGTFSEGKTINEDEYLFLSNLDNIILLNEETISVDLDIVSKNANLVKDIHNLEPNYLRKTEAENNYDKKNDN